MKKIFYLLALLSFPHWVSAQKLMKIVYINKGAITTNPKEAEWLIAIRKVDGRYERNDYTMNGPLKRVKTFKDLNQTILDGPYLEYDNNGYLLSAGFYTSNKKSGRWFHYNDSGNIVKTEQYEGDGIFDENSMVGNYKDSVIPASFKTGKNEWLNYLHENLNKDNMTNTKRDDFVKISFLITTAGTLKSFILLKSEYFHIDNEIIRTISSSPKWNPATYNRIAMPQRYVQHLNLDYLFHEN